MRISDWSSDVCSSDLLHQCAEHPKGAQSAVPRRPAPAAGGSRPQCPQAAQPAQPDGKIRVFDPACGSGNFLVIAYKQMREIEAEINKRRGESESDSDIPLTNFRGIELRDFPAEIARLALIRSEEHTSEL